MRVTGTRTNAMARHSMSTAEETYLMASTKMICAMVQAQLQRYSFLTVMQ